MSIVLDPSTTKYMIKAHIKAEGIVEKSDVVGAIFGQTEGLLGDELDLRELQRSARVGRIEVEIEARNGKSEGTILIPTSTDKVDTAILAAALESIDRVGPCKAKITIDEIEDVRVAKRKKIVERAKELLGKILEESKIEGASISDNVRQALNVEEIEYYGPDHCPAGPNIDSSDSIIIVEGRRDVLNLLKYGIKNVIAVGGTNVPKTIIDLSKEKITTAFVDGDRGGELILKELLQVAEIDFVARAPPTREVEEIPQKLIMKALKNKIPAEQYAEMYGIELKKEEKKPDKISEEPSHREEFTLPENIEKYKKILKDLSGSLKAVLLDKEGKELKKIPVRELTDRLKKSKNVSAIVFDGVITQRLVDIANEQNVQTIVGMKLGNVTKIPTTIKIYTKEDLQ
ncbi:MAG TPA: DNA primase [Thermoplasmatales archaeon]|mgnify:CR=1 FL=1|nr:MAG: DNA primase [Thermoplasmata archaeon]HDO69897.1 DNA primase [Thermoplasmatales archaeon]HEX08261.1 DNA primase [Thermoplasmatales archaeon]